MIERIKNAISLTQAGKYSEAEKIYSELLKENSDIILIDVRTRDEFRYNHLDGAVNIPMQDINEKKVQQFVRNKSNVIIVYCEYGGRSKKALNKLKKMGFVNVYNLEGGLEAI